MALLCNAMLPLIKNRSDHIVHITNIGEMGRSDTVFHDRISPFIVWSIKAFDKRRIVYKK